MKKEHYIRVMHKVDEFILGSETAPVVDIHDVLYGEGIDPADVIAEVKRQLAEARAALEAQETQP